MKNKPSKIKICYLTDLYPPNDIGGAERIAYYESKMMADQGHEVSVVATTEEQINSELKYKIEIRDGVKIYYFYPTRNFFRISPYSSNYSLPKKILLSILSHYNPYSFLILNRILEEEKPDIVHAHYTFFISYWGLRAVNARTTKLIITFHTYQYECLKGGLLKKKLFKRESEICNATPLICKFRNFLFRKIIPEPSIVIAISKFIKDRLRETGFKNIVYLPNGVKISDTRIKTLEQAPEILYVGRLTKAKGVHLLIRAFNDLKPNGFILRIIGDGEDRRYFESLAAGNENILFMGKIPHEKLALFYKKCHVVVVPSIWYEVMNTVICEAMAYGKPVIASDTPGNKDLILDGQTGYLFPVGETSKLTEYLKLLIANRHLTKKMGAKAMQRIRQFSQDRHFNRLLNIYYSVLHQ